MLEVRDLRKVYKTKNGAAVNALDGVSLQFPETGMVFLLGRSGSGKSTLLNVCGGLDAPTSGEIIVKGRSSKDFTQSDFDSYRNTFIGFIFQEYNILNEFSVEDNIALALELQGKPKDKAAIEALLEQVDLTGYAKRKPNTLSGGQKQRIAIARALIKSPEIIMADEPTGALDSNTGKQVLETLKKLSHDKLVIVVSHDRDFAEQYGDRIIELKDGKILSDVSKTQLEQQALSANMNVVGDVLCIKRGSDLTDADFEQIRSFLKRSDEDVVIASNGNDIAKFKQVSRISDSGDKEVFRDTDHTAFEGKQYTKEESRFIRSKLPLKHAIKIGASGLKSKPFRLFLTVILCTVAFVLFSLLSTLNFYDSHSTFVQTMIDTEHSVIQLEKDYKTTVIWYEHGTKQHEYEGFNNAWFTSDELKEVASLYSADAFGAFSTSANFNLRQHDSSYWVNAVSSFAVLPEGNTLRQRISGEYPQAKNEIVISSYCADVLYNCKAYGSDGELLSLASAQEVIGKSIILNGYTYKITGILDSGEIPPEYEALKETDEPNYSLQMNYQSYLNDELHLIAFVTQERLKAIAAESPLYVESVYNYTSLTAALKHGGEYVLPEWGGGNYRDPSSVASDKVYMAISSDKTVPADNEAILSSAMFASLVQNAYYRMAESAGENYKLIDSFYASAELASRIQQGGYYESDKEGGKEEFVAFTDEQLQAKMTELIAAVKRDKLNMTLGMKLFDRNNSAAMGELHEFTVIGVYLENARYQEGSLVVSQTVFDSLWNEQKATVDYYSETKTNYMQPSDALYSRAYLPFEHSAETAENFWNVYRDTEWEEDDTRLRLSGNFINSLQMVDEMVKGLSQVFLYVGLVLAVFAILLFSNFISVSISQKKKEIGILRAVGARSADVFKIFFSESFVIAAICTALSTVASLVICNLINAELATEIGASLFVFGAPSFAVLVAIALITVFLATFLPVYNAARKKPVDSIRAL